MGLLVADKDEGAGVHRQSFGVGWPVTCRGWNCSKVGFRLTVMDGLAFEMNYESSTRCVDSGLWEK